MMPKKEEEEKEGKREGRRKRRRERERRRKRRRERERRRRLTCVQVRDQLQGGVDLRHELVPPCLPDQPSHL